MSVFAMPPPPARKPSVAIACGTLNSSHQIFQNFSDTHEAEIVSDDDAVHPDESSHNQVYSLSALSEDLQQAYRWANLAFESQDESNCGDPLAIDAFEKGCKNLVSAASKLVDRERFTRVLRDQGFGFYNPPPGYSRPASPPCAEEPYSVHENSSTSESDGISSQRKDSPAGVLASFHGSGPSLRTKEDFEDLKVQQYVTNRSELPRFADVASLEAPKEILREAVIFPLLHPHLFQGVRQPWKGILLHGPPGTGKTELAKAVAGECDATFVLISPSTLLSKFVGESERMMARIFDFAKAVAPTVLFFDEIDALGLSRSVEGNDQGIRRLMAELLVQFNLLKAPHRVTILAATNRIEDIDCALLRRFERRIEIGLLPESERAKLMELKMKGTETQQDIDFSRISRETEGYSGADLELLCREAAMFGVRELMQDENLLKSGCAIVRPVTLEDFMLALQVIFPISCSHSGPALTTHEQENTTRRKRSADSRSGQQTPTSEGTVSKKATVFR